MVQINFARKEINCKLVYYGPGMSGKTTNLEMVHKRTPDGNRGDLTSISTDGDRTLFFDFMPLDLGEIAGMKTKFHLYTVPGQVYYNSTRKLVLNGADGVIFVADSSRSKLAENRESLDNLRENLAEMGKDFTKFPVVLQWNKRDMPDAMTVEELQQELNPLNFPTFEAIASKGEGVFQTLKALSAKVLQSINSTERAGLGSGGLGARGANPAGAAAAKPAGAAPAKAAAASAANPAPALRIERNEVGATTCQSVTPPQRMDIAAKKVDATTDPAVEAAPQPTPQPAPKPAPAVAAAPPAPQPAVATAPRPTQNTAAAQRDPDVALAASMKNAASAAPRSPKNSLSQSVRVIGAPSAPAVKRGMSGNAIAIIGVVIALAAAAAWFFLNKSK